MRALLATGDAATTGVTDLDESALDGAVLVDVSHSSINYKDGLAIGGRPGVIRDWPKVPGIDLVGTVADDAAGWSAGERVLVNGWGLGESRHGGLAERARVEPHMLTRIPAGLTDVQAAAVGTAGYTAALGVLALQDAGMRLDGADILVTGAGGGVGSIAVQLLARAGAAVTALTGRVEQLEPWLRSLGAVAVEPRASLGEAGRPLQSARWDAVADAVGGTILANALAQLRPGGHATACGLTAGADLPATVLPFILRGITLHGVHSVEQPAERRERAWGMLAAKLDLAALDEATEVVGLEGAVDAAERILASSIRGRVVVDVRA
ncbi:acryloyl-CoA reductase [Agrococcus terreus]|uniref:acrylyl-CoA reductase family protein n=1 Tax=Agrococcus terreus TaxID=574649 RepID=UPI0038511041